MTSSKHPTPSNPADRELGSDVPPLRSDLARNPGIGQSKGLSGADPEEIEAGNTVEGDTANDPDTASTGRTNR